MDAILELNANSMAWLDFIAAAKHAGAGGLDVRISVCQNVKGQPMVAFKVGRGGLWSAHRVVEDGKVT